MVIVIAGAEEAQPGWGGPLALLAAAAALFALHVVLKKIRNPSPTPPRGAGSREKPQVEAGSDPGDPDDDPGWWGRIVEVNGVRMRQVRQVWRTGSAQLPAAPADQRSGEDDELDLDLEDTREPIGQWMAARDGLVGTNELIRQAAARYGVSESTAKRALKAARAATEDA